MRAKTLFFRTPGRYTRDPAEHADGGGAEDAHRDAGHGPRDEEQRVPAGRHRERPDEVPDRQPDEGPEHEPLRVDQVGEGARDDDRDAVGDQEGPRDPQRLAAAEVEGVGEEGLGDEGVAEVDCEQQLPHGAYQDEEDFLGDG